MSAYEPDLSDDIVEIIAQALVDDEYGGCCGHRSTEGRCCMSPRAEQVLAALERYGIRTSDLQERALAHGGKAP